MRRVLWSLGLLVLAFSLAVVFPEPAAARGRGAPPVQVRRVVFPVTLSDGNTYDLVAYAYARPGRWHSRIVQILVHGATYDHRYWDVPDIDGIRYSYAREMAERGYVVVAIDQLGAGESDRPDGDFFGLEEAANALHQVAASLRRNRNPLHHRFTKIAYVGHSNGSVTSIYAQATYGDADAVVSTGWVHGFRGLPVDPSDPLLQDVLASPYIVMPGPVRTALFYFEPTSDPAVAAFDNEVLANAMPRRQFLDLLGVHADITARGPGGMTTATRSQEVTVPVLVQAGDSDFAIAPGSVVDDSPTEEEFFSSAPSVEVQVLEAMGHAFNTHFTNVASWDGIDAWLTATLGCAQ